MVIDYLFEKGVINRLDKRRKDYIKKLNEIRIKVCRTIRNLARDEPEKGIKPVIKVEKLINDGRNRKQSCSYRVDRNRRITVEDWFPIWQNWIVLIDKDPLVEYAEDEILQDFRCEYCKKLITATSLENHLEEEHRINLKQYQKLFKN